MTRPRPFDLVFATAEDRFRAIQHALEASGTDAVDRDAFLMVREVVELVRELRPDGGLGEGIDQLVAVVQHAYLFWAAGEPTLSLSAHRLAALLTPARGQLPDRPTAPDAYYIQMPERRVWAETVPGCPPEPLDGCFVHTSLRHATGSGELRVLGIFGIRPDREGFTVVETAGPRPEALARDDGTPLFAPVLPGGAAAGLFSIIGTEELLELGWRSRAASYHGEAG